MDTNCVWVAGLSNGETIIEGQGIAQEIEHEISPWQKLQKYIVENGLEITSLKIRNKDRDFVLPSRGKKPYKFGGETPLNFNYFRRVSSDVGIDGSFQGQTDLYIEIQAIYEDVIVSLLVDEHNPNLSWIVVKKING